MIDLRERIFLQSDLQANDLIGQAVCNEHFDEVITESSHIDLENHSPIVYLDLKEKHFDELLPNLNSISYPKSNRKKLGSNNLSMLFGAVPAKFNHDSFCNIGAIVNKSPELHTMLGVKYSTVMDRLMQMYLPEHHEIGHQIFSEIGFHKDWQMSNTFWTSGIINKNSPHNFHLDGDNAKGAYSAMITLKSQMAGGYLVIPQYRIAFEVTNRSVIFFCGKELIHGVSPMNIHKGGYRYSVVFYTTDDLKYCDSYQEEMDKAEIL